MSKRRIAFPDSRCGLADGWHVLTYSCIALLAVSPGRIHTANVPARALTCGKKPRVNTLSKLVLPQAPSPMMTSFLRRRAYVSRDELAHRAGGGPARPGQAGQAS